MAPMELRDGGRNSRRRTQGHGQKPGETPTTLPAESRLAKLPRCSRGPSSFVAVMKTTDTGHRVWVPSMDTLWDPRAPGVHGGGSPLQILSQMYLAWSAEGADNPPTRGR